MFNIYFHITPVNNPFIPLWVNEARAAGSLPEARARMCVRHTLHGGSKNLYLLEGSVKPVVPHDTITDPYRLNIAYALPCGDMVVGGA